jgi:GPH family glycoside/pentoside/hexuronide:cation symporter
MSCPTDGKDTIEFDMPGPECVARGLYIWTFAIALGSALAGFLIGQSLDLFGYVPNTVQSATSILGIRLLIGLLPAIMILLSNLVLAFYPLDRKRYEELQAQIQTRQVNPQ